MATTPPLVVCGAVALVAEPKEAAAKPAPEPKEAPGAAPKDVPRPPGHQPPLAPGQSVPEHASGTVQLGGVSPPLLTLLREAHAGREAAEILQTPAVQALGKSAGMSFAVLNLGLALLRPGHGERSR